MPHMSDTSQWAVQVVVALGICDWIEDLGGPAVIITSDIFMLIQHRNNQTSPSGYTFIPDTPQIFGCIQYRNGNIPGGNTTTGC